MTIPLPIDNGEYQDNAYANADLYISLYARERARTGVEREKEGQQAAAEWRANHDRVLAQRAARKKAERKPPVVETVYRVGADGWPKAVNYKAAELRKWFYFCFNRSFPKLEAPGCVWHLNPALQKWIDTAGSGRVESIVRFTCENWNCIQRSFASLEEAEWPSLNIIYGYREGIERLMLPSSTEKTAKRKKFAPSYRGDQYETSGKTREAAPAIGF